MNLKSCDIVVITSLTTYNLRYENPKMDTFTVAISMKQITSGFLTTLIRNNILVLICEPT